jgi:hypothetical protein
MTPDAVVTWLVVRVDGLMDFDGQCLEMLRIDAAPIVATVMNLVADGDRADEQLVSGAVSNRVLAPQGDGAVANLAGVLEPVPASIRRDLVPHTMILRDLGTTCSALR